MADPAPHTDPYLGTYRPVPAAGPGVCAVCHSGPAPGRDVCYSCTLTMAQVSCPTPHVIPVSLYELPGQLWHVLRHYKDGSEPGRGLFTLQIAAMLARFADSHLPCLAGLLGGDPDLVTTVPSTRRPRRAAGHPLDAAVTAVTRLAKLHAPVLRPGPGPAGHNAAADDAFLLSEQLPGARVLLIDDTFTTGARVQSAASALRRGGAAAVVAVPVGRVVWPDWNENCRRIWQAACELPFSFDRCCLCRDGPGAAAPAG
jgi:predicted amidophosphoribosyltransferase